MVFDPVLPRYSPDCLSASPLSLFPPQPPVKVELILGAVPDNLMGTHTSSYEVNIFSPHESVLFLSLRLYRNKPHTPSPSWFDTLQRNRPIIVSYNSWAFGYVIRPSGFLESYSSCHNFIITSTILEMTALTR